MHTFDPEVAKSFKVEQETVAVFQPEIFWSPHENKTYTLTKKSATYKEIVHFIRRNSVPLVGQRTKKNAFKFTDRPMIVIYYDVNYDHQYIKVGMSTTYEYGDWTLFFLHCIIADLFSHTLTGHSVHSQQSIGGGKGLCGLQPQICDFQ